MENDEDKQFDCFIRERKSNLRRIASATKGEHQLSDVVNSAWLIAHDMSVHKGIVIDFLDHSYQERVLSHVYQELVRYTETLIRDAVRLDHSSADDDADTDAVHPLMRKLPSDDGRDPLAELMAREAARQQSQKSDDCCSLASAYAYLLHQFDNKMRAVADFLLISESEARRHCANAALLAQYQQAVAMNHGDETGFRLRPWRRFRFQRVPVQLELAFGEADELPLLQ